MDHRHVVFSTSSITSGGWPGKAFQLCLKGGIDSDTR